MNRCRENLVIALCAIYSLMAGLYPFEFADRTLYFEAFPWKFLTTLFVPIKSVRVNDFLQNIAYFLPWGTICYLVAGSRLGTRPIVVLWAGLVGGLVSIAIEVCQIFFSRHPSVFDVLANTIGAMLGARLCALSPIDLQQVFARILVRAQQSRVLLLTVLLFAAVPLVIFVSQFPWFDFHNWNRSYTFQLANEASLDRPWLGRLYLAAIYDRALSPEEIARHHQIGVSNGALGRRVTRGLIAFYTFAKDRGSQVRDVSGYRQPLNLTLSPRSHFHWLGADNGIEVVRPAILVSAGPAEKLHDALTASNEISVEVWMASSSVVRNRPVRIVSFSRDLSARNFTLGQAGFDIDFQLRTPMSGANGTVMNLRTTDGPVTLGKSHVVVTYKDGIKKLYVDGRMHSNSSDVNQPELIVGFGTKKNLVSQVAYSLVYFFPASFFLAFIIARCRKDFIATLLVPAAIGMSLLGGTELFQAYNIARAINVSLLGYGIITIMIGAFSGATFGMRVRSYE
jgi:VanZ family protein